MKKMTPHRNPVRSDLCVPNRKQSGDMLIEAMVCVLLTGIVSTALVTGFMHISTMGTATQGQLDVAAISTEIFDQLRAQQFSFLSANLGNHTAIVNGAAPTGDVVFPRPLMRDTALQYYHAANVDDRKNTMHVTNNSVTVVLTPLSVDADGNVSTIQATVTITWGDGRGSHTASNSTILANQGLNG
jgi:hypothetical protein